MTSRNPTCSHTPGSPRTLTEHLCPLLVLSHACYTSTSQQQPFKVERTTLFSRKMRFRKVFNSDQQVASSASCVLVTAAPGDSARYGTKGHACHSDCSASRLMKKVGSCPGGSVKGTVGTKRRECQSNHVTALLKNPHSSLGP